MSVAEFRGKQIPVTIQDAPDAQLALGTDLIHNWLENIDESINIKSLEIQSVDKFGSSRVGFVKVKSEAERNGTRIPGIVVLRGSSVAMLLVLTDEETNEKYSILTCQPRVPVGKLILELPAGMTDGGAVRSAAIKELQEECGLEVKNEELIDLTEIAYSKDTGLFTSPGLLDETIRLFAWKKTMKHQEIQKLEGKIGGESAHEQIILRLVKFEDVWKLAPDAKTLSALYLYQKLTDEHKI